jgi:hypothetical protein
MPKIIIAQIPDEKKAAAYSEVSVVSSNAEVCCSESVGRNTNGEKKTPRSAAESCDSCQYHSDIQPSF